MRLGHMLGQILPIVQNASAASTQCFRKGIALNLR